MQRVNLWVGPTVGSFDQHIGHYSSLIRSVKLFPDLPLLISWHSHYDTDRGFVPFDDARRQLDKFRGIATSKFGIDGEYYSLEDDRPFIDDEIQRLSHVLKRHPVRGIYQSTEWPVMSYFREVDYQTGFFVNQTNVVLYDRRMQFVYMYHYIVDRYPSVTTIELTLGSDLTTTGWLIYDAAEEFKQLRPEYRDLTINVHACGLLTYQSKKISKSKIHNALVGRDRSLINTIDADAFRRHIESYPYADPIEFDVMDCYKS